MLLTIVSFIFVLGILIFIHELGHFIVAKRVGIKVEKFSLGFPPNLISKTIGETTYCIGVIPLGGFVKMVGENPDEPASGAPNEFMSKTVGQRAAVIFAGPFMNYVLSIAILIGIYLVGRPVFDPDRILVGAVTKNDPAAKAGLLPGDQIIAIDGEPVHSFDTLRTRIYHHLATPLNLTWLHNGDTVNATMSTRLEELGREDGGIDSIGVIGFTQKILGHKSLGLWTSVRQGFVDAHVIVWETVKFLGKVVSLKVSLKMIGGPVFIAQQSGKEAEKGATSLFFFMAMLSVNLAVLNVLPIPILDGGHLLFLAIEKLRGTPLSVRARAIAQQVGIIFLFGLILLVTYHDILRAFGKY